ncbi:hypothetical protein [Lactiplantibacillus mudanjiangensis]|uniref:Uncharacterized protein n=1 Tax=Lactiplantibacillus mudanjiangensis TaxID=1296538 RepID=A0A660E9W5_9LACO|nr:hypothetical protein [Lactiplantibacillus mudanjiangensis]VDG19207.1 hypothetical protein [Lactobacillus sp. CBA3605] [Lactiplantibacillus mudanjiangensis]VDG25630.1 hypothetical protein [Lactobacillus sp. CBA3605] [Lactiplantibacillus mudanjiangensis]VDG29972.1 hypothetical protein [Lactobacillus sp. CBA3605] [Lactiplantibacillus mudanjiangensis]
MQVEPFIATLPTTSGLQKIQTGDLNWTAEDTEKQTTPGYYWHELTLNGQHQWRLVAAWATTPATVTTITPAPLNTVLYTRQPVIEMLIDDWVGHFDRALEVTTPDNITHRLWQVTDLDVQADITDVMTNVTPRQTWLTTAPTPLISLVTDTEWTKFTEPLATPAHLIDRAD